MANLLIFLPVGIKSYKKRDRISYPVWNYASKEIEKENY